MLVCTLAMLYAAAIEGWRLDVYRASRPDARGVRSRTARADGWMG
jgi:hypothetical protein